MSKKKNLEGLAGEILAIVDTETTHASPLYGRIMEIAVLRVEQGAIVHTFHSLLNPDRPIQPVVESITGISAAELEHAPAFADRADALEEILDGAVFVAHNARFDYAFLRGEFRRMGRRFTARCLCTVALSKRMHPEFLHHDLSSLIARHALPCEHRHRALDDARAVWFFLQHLEKTHGAGTLGSAIRRETMRSTPAHLTRESVQQLPESPGVYLMYGGKDELLYVGKSTNIRRRVQSHFSAGSVEGSDLHLCQETHRIESRTTAGELGALLLESRLIKELRPVHNKVARAKRALIVLLRRTHPDGYSAVTIETRERICPDEIGDVLTVFKHRQQARQFLADAARDHALCHKLVGLESTPGPCFQRQLHRCKGACCGEEDVAAYNGRFEEAFRERRIQAWPYRTGILIKEARQDGSGEEAFLVDHWCLLSSIRTVDDGFQEVVPGFDTFDYDSYKILLRYLRNPRNRRSIRILRQPEYASIVAQLAGGS